MNHIIYKITNTINGKFYIGKHSTKNINDSYMGSGVAIKRAIKKYGKDNFIKEIISIFDNEADCLSMESRLVTIEIVNSQMSYNMTCGGRGSFSHIDISGDNNPMKREEIKDKFRGDLNPAKRPDVREKLSNSSSGENNAMFGVFGELHPRYGIPRTDMVGEYNPAKTTESRKKLSDHAKSRTGENSARFKGWVYTPEGRYPSKRDAGLANKVSNSTLNKNLNDDTKPEWYFVPKS